MERVHCSEQLGRDSGDTGCGCGEKCAAVRESPLFHQFVQTAKHITHLCSQHDKVITVSLTHTCSVFHMQSALYMHVQSA